MALRIAAQVTGLEKNVQDVVNRINRRGGINLKMNERGFTQPLGRITSKANEFTKSLEASNARVIAFGASVGVLNAVKDAFESLVTSVIKVEKSLTDINVVLNANAANLDKFGKGLFRVAKNTAQTFDVVAEAATEFARQGLSMEETLKRTNDALILTRLTGMKSADSVKNLTAAMNTFSKAGLTSTQVISKMAAVDVEFAVSADDLAAAISRTGQSASEAGVSIDQLIGVVTAAQQKTARGGAVIGNAFKTIFTRIRRPETLNQLEQLGIAVRDVEYNTLPAIQILNNLASTYDHLSDAQKSQIGQTVAGVFQINILKAALSDASSQNSILARATDISSRATDEAIVKNERLNQTIAALATQTQIGLLQLSKNIGEIALAPGMKSVLDFVNGLVEGLNKLTTGEGAGAKFFQGFLAGIGKIATGPGLVLFVGIIGKLFANAFKFAAQSMRDILGIQTQAQRLKAIEESIVQVLMRNGTVSKELIALEGNRAAQEAVVLKLIQQQSAALAAQSGLARGLSPGLARAGVQGDLTVKPKRRGFSSGGYVPNFAPSSGRYTAGGNRISGLSNSRALTTSEASSMRAGSLLPSDVSAKELKSAQNAINRRKNKSSRKNPIDMSGLGVYLVTPRMGGKPMEAVAKGKAAGAPYFKFLTTGLNSAKFQGRQNLKGNPKARLEERVSKSVFKTTSDYINTIKPGDPPRTVSAAEVETGFRSPKSGGVAGAKGALKAVVGSAFEVGLTSAMDYKSAIREKAGDFDIRGGRNIEGLSELLNLRGRLNLGDFKVSDSTSSKQSFANKLAKEMRAGFIMQGTRGGAPSGTARQSEIQQRNQIVLQRGTRAGASTGFKAMARSGGRFSQGGLVPNFSPLGDAVGREMAAGVPSSAIRVGSSSSLVSGGNPGGVGVYNTIHEPGGLGQGISRSISEGRNPSTYGVPNFAPQPYGIPMGGFPGMNTLQKAVADALKKNYQELSSGNISLRRFNSANKAAAKASGMTGAELRTFAAQTKMTKAQFKQAGLNIKGGMGGIGGRMGGIGGMGSMGLMMGLPMLSGMLESKTGGPTGTSGALSGAGMGAMVGMMFPGWGTAIGLAVGALAGFTDATKKAAEAERKASYENAAQKGSQAAQALGFTSQSGFMDHMKVNITKLEASGTALNKAIQGSNQIEIGDKGFFGGGRKKLTPGKLRGMSLDQLDDETRMARGEYLLMQGANEKQQARRKELSPTFNARKNIMKAQQSAFNILQDVVPDDFTTKMKLGGKYDTYDKADLLTALQEGTVGDQEKVILRAIKYYRDRKSALSEQKKSQQKLFNKEISLLNAQIKINKRSISENIRIAEGRDIVKIEREMGMSVAQRGMGQSGKAAIARDVALQNQIAGATANTATAETKAFEELFAVAKSKSVNLGEEGQIRIANKITAGNIKNRQDLSDALIKEVGGSEASKELKEIAISKIKIENQLIGQKVNKTKLEGESQTRILGQRQKTERLQEAYNKTLEAGINNVMEGVRTDLEGMGRIFGENTTQAFLSNLEQGLNDVATGSKNAKDAFIDFSRGIFREIQGLLMKRLAGQITNALFPEGGGGAGGSALGLLKSSLGFNKGGQVPAMVQGGEYLFSRKAVSSIGLGNLQTLNRGGTPQGFADGGRVSSRLLANPDPEMSSVFALRNQKRQQDRQYAMQLSAWKKQRKNAAMQSFFTTFLSMGMNNMAGGTGFFGNNPTAAATLPSAGLSTGTAASANSFAWNQALSASRAKELDFGAPFVKPSGYHKSLPDEPFRKMGFERRGYGPIDDLDSTFQQPSLNARRGHARGGLISGGSGVRDDIPATLQGGEFVMRKSAVQKHGRGFMDRLNGGMAEGGPVGQATPTSPASSTSGSPSVSININMNNGGQDSPDVSTASESGEEAQQNREFAQKIKTVVMQVIREEQRVGGTLSKKNAGQ